MTTVVDVHVANLRKLGYDSLENWLSQPNHVYIGREMSYMVKGAKGSKWQNKFTTKKYGLGESLRLYEENLIKNKDLMANLDELKGKVLGCWCNDDKNKEEHCH